jgi:hypothetical protein
MVKVTSSIAEKRLGDVPEDKYFWCYDGKVIKNLRELMTAFHSMSEETFRYHSTEIGNDFFNWVRDVIGDEKLARDLQSSRNRSQAAKRVTDRIAWLEDKLVA